MVSDMSKAKRSPSEIHINPDIPLDPFQVECPTCQMFVVSAANPVIWIPGESESKVNERRLCRAVDLFHFHHRYMACLVDSPQVCIGNIPHGIAPKFYVGNRRIYAYALIEKLRKHNAALLPER